MSFDPRKTHIGNVVNKEDPTTGEIQQFTNHKEGYAIIYLCFGGDCLCRDCALEQYHKEQDPENFVPKNEALYDVDMHWEGEEQCANCNEPIESSYGPIEE